MLSAASASHRVLSLPPFVPNPSATPAPATVAIDRSPISVIMLTKNSSPRLAEALAALQWCDEVVVFDTGSTDATLTIAATFPNVALHQLTGAFPGFGLARQYAVSLARNDWILSVDSDEVVSPELAEEIRRLPLDPGCVYQIPFANYYDGKHITTCGWAPDRHERLFNRTRTNFSSSDVHEKLNLRGLRTLRLQGAMRHYSYRGTHDFIRKMGAYSELFARQNAGRKRASAFKAASRSLWAFLKSYVLERGFTQGAEGLLISAYKSQTVFWKYMMLREANARNTS